MERGPHKSPRVSELSLHEPTAGRGQGTRSEQMLIRRHFLGQRSQHPHVLSAAQGIMGDTEEPRPWLPASGRLGPHGNRW